MSSSKKLLFDFFRNYVVKNRGYQTMRVIRPQPQPQTPAAMLKDMPNSNILVFAIMAGMGGSSVFYMLSKPGILEQLSTPTANLTQTQPLPEQEKRKLTAREKRFIKFASVEYDGQIYMTPQVSPILR